MTARDLTEQVNIVDVWTRLGGPDLRHRRGKAFWRDGDGYNVSLNADRGVYYDHGRGSGGGVLDLIGTVLGCDRRGAVSWLADHLGVKLDDNPVSAAERRAWAQRRARAEQQARELAEWRADYLAALRQQRNAHWDAERNACATARQLLAAGDDGSPRWDVVWRHVMDDVHGDKIDAEIVRVAAMGTAELVALRSRRELAA